MNKSDMTNRNISFVLIILGLFSPSFDMEKVFKKIFLKEVDML